MLISRLAAVWITIVTLTAQTSWYAPSGFATVSGTDGNALPFTALSARYQQVHDAADLALVFGSSTATLRSIGFRKHSSGSIASRSMEVAIQLGHTSISARRVVPSFAANLGPAPVAVLPFTTVNLPALTATSVPEPLGWSFPFTTPFVYQGASGNLCWELRMRNASTSSSAGLDATAPDRLISLPPFGGGCIASGQSTPAVSEPYLELSTGAYRQVLQRGAVHTPATLLIGVQRQRLSLPGLCAPLEVAPLFDLASFTSSLGRMHVALSLGPLYGQPRLHVVAQFAFLDPGLPLGVGLSNATELVTSGQSPTHCARIFAFAQTLTGAETQTSGSLSVDFGVVTIFGG